MGREGHVFLTASSDDICVTQLDVLCCQSNRAQARAAHLIDRPCRAFLREACIDMGLARWVLPLSCGQNLTQNGFGNFGWVDACACDEFFEDSCPQLMSRRIGE